LFQIENLIEKVNLKSGILVNEAKSNDIAIIGIGLCFPQADTPDEFWMNIVNGLDSVSELSEQRKRQVYAHLSKTAQTETQQELIPLIKAGFLENIDVFDSAFFGILPSEAKLIAPLQRKFLEVAWKALEDAGYANPQASGGKTGIYLGYIGDLEGYRYREIIESEDDAMVFSSLVGNLSSMMASRIAYWLNLRGPSLLVDTACSSSLVALHLALQGLKNGDCDMALVGGAKISLLPVDRPEDKLGAESDDFYTRSFDQSADGYGTGEGVAAIVLKNLKSAQFDGDPVYAVIKGSAINQDGASVGITAPNPQAQREVLVEAWRTAGIDPITLCHIEAHGTATKLGDPIEMDGLKHAFLTYTNKKQFCAVSSIKSNIGHLYESAGIAGVIKTALMLKNRTIPSGLHFSSPNRHIDFEQGPVYVNTRMRTYEHLTPMRAGVSSFGLSGTNAHVVLEEYIACARREYEQTVCVLAVSGNTRESLQLFVEELICKSKFICWTDMCYTLCAGRAHHSIRLAAVVSSREEMYDTLARWKSGDWQGGKMSFYGEHYIIDDLKHIRVPGEITSSEVEQLSQKAQALGQANINTLSKLSELCSLYVAGAKINWAWVYTGMDVKKTNLPVYPFAGRSHWVGTDQVRTQEENLFHRLVWEKEYPCDGEPVLSHENISCVVVHGGGKHSRAFAKLAVKKCGAIEVGPSDYHVFRELSKTGTVKLVLATSLDSMPGAETRGEIDANLKCGALSLLSWSRVAMECEVTELLVITCAAHYVREGDVAIVPENASLCAFAHVLNKELSCLTIIVADIDDIQSVNIQAMFHTQAAYTQYAYRDNVRYIRKLTSITLAYDKTQSGAKIRKGGAYVITGGLGGIGLMLMTHLARQGVGAVALIGRSGFPKREQWDALQEETQRQSVQLIREAEALGTSIEIYRADVCVPQEVDSVFSILRSRNGRIDGVFHLAGVEGIQLAEEIDEISFTKVIGSKVYGSRNIYQATRDYGLDFLILFSSVAATMGTIGQCAYSAANAYMDAMGENGEAIAIQWGTFRDVGMAVRVGMNTDTAIKAMPSEKMFKALDVLLCAGQSGVLVAPLHYSAQTARILRSEGFVLSREIDDKLRVYEQKRKDTSEQTKILKKTGQADGTSLTEKKLADMLCALMELDDIDIYDNFFEMGANSIMLKQFHVQVDKEYPGLVSVAELFAHSSVFRLAKHMDEKNSLKNEVVLTPNVTAHKRADERVYDLLGGVWDDKQSIRETVQKLMEL